MRAVAHRRALLLWAGIAVAGMLALGLLVGKSSTPLDRWVRRLSDTPARWLLIASDPWVMTTVLLFGVLVALYLRRKRLAVVMAVSPVAGIALVALIKPLFGRHSGTALAYPSGHTTALVVVTGMLVLLAGAPRWAVLAAAVVSMLGAIGQAVTYHYFTDTVGALLLGGAVVCVAAIAAKLDTRQPGCDADHSPR